MKKAKGAVNIAAYPKMFRWCLQPIAKPVVITHTNATIETTTPASLLY
jgi:hypothetical protein